MQTSGLIYAKVTYRVLHGQSSLRIVEELKMEIRRSAQRRETVTIDVAAPVYAQSAVEENGRADRCRCSASSRRSSRC